jgi:hypothetical protein
MSEIEPFDWDWLSTRGNYLTEITPEIAEALLEPRCTSTPARSAPRQRR